MTTFDSDRVRLFASSKNWIEGNAVSQLRGMARLPDVELAVGLPDLHPGKCGPVGAALVTSRTIYPHIIGNDVGCGMGLWRSELSARKVKLDRWAGKLTDLDQPWNGDRAAWLEAFNAAPSDQDDALGTIGGGNHFAELQRVEEVLDTAAFGAAGLDADALLVLVHSGSRGLGNDVLRFGRMQDAFDGLAADSEAAHAYLQRHDHAVKWAQASRALIASRFLNALGSDARRLLDLTHNYVARETIGGREGLVHRKGAHPSTGGCVVIPGSRGSLSYLALPCGDASRSANSVSHGAGRKWNRTDCRARLRDRFSPDELTQTDLGSRVICEDRDLLYEEAPQVYKNVAVVVQDLVDAGLVRVIATLRPLITYKVRRAAP